MPKFRSFFDSWKIFITKTNLSFQLKHVEIKINKLSAIN